MSSDAERRLETMFAEAPEPDPGAGEEALHRALRALQPVAAPRRGLRTAVLAFATAVVLLVVAAGSLAAAGALHVSFGAKPKLRPVTQLVLPQGAKGIAAVVDGGLSVAIKGGFRLQVPASAAALSPHAFYVAAGIGDRLVAMAPDGRLAWSHPVGGRVVAIAWAPDGIRIAYVVHAGRRYVLHVIYGNGINNTTIDRSVRAVKPSWRADSLAFAYVGGGGRAIVYDIGHQQHQVVAVSPPVTGVAFAPSGHTLALETPGGVTLADSALSRHIAAANVEAFGWLNGRLAVAEPGLNSAVIRLFAPDGTSRGSSPAHGIVRTITPKLVVVQQGRNLVGGHTTLLTVPRAARVRDLQVG
jgi:hypothetical protein